MLHDCLEPLGLSVTDPIRKLWERGPFPASVRPGRHRCKSIDRGRRIGGVELLRKTGGKSGAYERPPGQGLRAGLRVS